MPDPAESDVPMQPADSNLATVRAALSGSAVARQRLVELLSDLPGMVRVKNTRLGSPLSHHEIDDVVQNVLLSLWRKLAAYDGRVPLLYWAYGFGVIEIRRAIERRARRREQASPDEDLPGPAPAPPDGNRVLLHEGLAELDDPERQVLHMRHFEGLSFEEISARLGVVAGTAKTRYYRGLERLRVRLLPRRGEDA